MLLDLENDLDELRNVIDDPRFAAVRTELSQKLASYRAGDYRAAGVPSMP